MRFILHAVNQFDNKDLRFSWKRSVASRKYSRAGIIQGESTREMVASFAHAAFVRVLQNKLAVSHLVLLARRTSSGGNSRVLELADVS
jgi:hypothetical protein